MKRILLMLIVVFLAGIAHGQSIKSYVISSAGTSIMNADGGMYLSVGEPMNTEIHGDGAMVSQGFLQDVLFSNSVPTENLLQETFSVSPNPTSAELNLIIPESKGDYQVLVYGITGEVVKNEIIQGVENNIDFSNVTQGTYFLKITKENKHSEVLKIVKIK